MKQKKDTPRSYHPRMTVHKLVPVRRYPDWTRHLPRLGAGFVVGLLLFALYTGFSRVSFSLPNIKLPEIDSKSSRQDNAQNYQMSGIDPFEVLQHITEEKDEIILVDVRDAKEYERGHIVSAVSAPIVNEQEFIKTVKTLDLEKPIVLYGRTQFSSDSQSALELLRKKGRTDVRTMQIGWNEWSHMSATWIPDLYWNDINISDTIIGSNE